MSIVTNLPLHVTATTTLTAADSCKIVFIDSAAAAIIITLPALQPGLYFRMRFTNALALAHTVTFVNPTATAIFNGSVLAASDILEDGRMNRANRKTSIIAGVDINPGDFLDFTCDGVMWGIFGCVSLYTAITFT